MHATTYTFQERTHNTNKILTIVILLADIYHIPKDRIKNLNQPSYRTLSYTIVIHILHAKPPQKFSLKTP